ncbi:hypothetical protein BGY98DRAFT_975815 [Russula aff. rugulosa BPL654]|nr:hypothetical protein BGY98DRAFT_975815 [Russula aff. rugulosa BPL654]
MTVVWRRSTHILFITFSSFLLSLSLPKNSCLISLRFSGMSRPCFSSLACTWRHTSTVPDLFFTTLASLGHSPHHSIFTSPCLAFYELASSAVQIVSIESLLTADSDARTCRPSATLNFISHTRISQ